MNGDQDIKTFTETVRRLLRVKMEEIQPTVNSPDAELASWIMGAGDDMVKRLMGYTIIAVMPSQGLDEAITSLRDIFEFSHETLRLKPPKPKHRQSISGKTRSGVRRPDLVISE